MKRGRWVEIGDSLVCSECRKYYRDLHPTYENTPFCPNCGAKMTGDRKEETENDRKSQVSKRP